jgi:hypothetical protein
VCCKLENVKLFCLNFVNPEKNYSGSRILRPKKGRIPDPQHCPQEAKKLRNGSLPSNDGEVLMLLLSESREEREVAGRYICGNYNIPVQ